MQNKKVEKEQFLDSSVLREYDIRGIVGRTLFPDDAYNIGRAFGTLVMQSGGKKISVGRDGRLSSPELENKLVQGLLSTGIDVTRVGVGPTPQLYFSVYDLKADGGIMVTGSHNPPEYNGFKMTLSGKPFFGEQIQNLGQMIERQDFINAEQGSLQEINIEENYCTRLLKDFVHSRELSIAWDCGNGAAGNIVKKLVNKLPGRHIVLFDEIDGTFPNHHPDPTVEENIKDLQTAVLENKCDLGIAFDGDGDRIGIVDETGKVRFADDLMTIFASEIIEENPEATVIMDVKSSNRLMEEVKRLGGNPVMWKTGHSLIKSKMQETGAPIAGELSGHIFFADKYYGFDDALYAAVRLINILNKKDKKVSEWFSSLKESYSTAEIRIEIEESQKILAMSAIAKDAKHDSSLSENKGKWDVLEIDGIRVTTPEGWWLLRASNTQNALVARAEAWSEDGLKDLIGNIKRYIAKQDLTLPENYS